MQPRINTCRICCTLVRFVIILLCLSGGLTVVFAGTPSSVVIRENIQPGRRGVLVQKLREITGWNDLTFDANGFLQLGTREPLKGSSSARQLLNRAIGGPNLILIEDASSRADIAFCQVTRAKSLEPTPGVQIFIVSVDFADFEKLMGDREARAAFDVGWAFLHEVDHVVMDSHDNADQHSFGECEESINKMRREVGLPVRAEYFFASLPYAPDPLLVSRLVRLRFEKIQKSKKVKHYWVIWDAAVVGGITDSRVASAL